MNDREKQFRERIKYNIAYCEDTPDEQIKEMASDMDYACTKRTLRPSDAREIAKVLFLLGYRKFHKNQVLLTQEELEEKYEPSGSFMAVARDLEDLKQMLADKVVISEEEYQEFEEFRSFMERNDWKDVKDIEDTLDKCQEKILKYYQPKLPKDSIIILKEDWKDNHDQAFMNGKKEGGKAMAEKIVNEIYAVLWDEKVPAIHSFINLDIKIREIATREGVEIKE